MPGRPPTSTTTTTVPRTWHIETCRPGTAATSSWTERGVEDVAFTIQQNLMATNPPLASSTWAERVEAYAQITGQPSPLVQS